MSIRAAQRALRNLGGFPGASHLARPPAPLEEPDVRPEPDADPINYYIEADPTNTYLSTNTGNFQGVILDDTTEVGGDPDVFDYDDSVSLTFVVAQTQVLIQPYTPGPPDDTGYALINWDVPVALGSVTVRVEVADATFSQVWFYDATNTGSSGDATSCIVLLPTPFIVPEGGGVRVTFRHTGTAVTLTLSGELFVRYSPV